MSRRLLARSLLIAAATALFCWFIGVQGARPVLVGLCVLAVAAVIPAVPVGRHGRWPTQPRLAYGRGSSQVWRLANRLRSLHSPAGGPDAALQHRLRRLAAARLARHGIAWEHPRAADELGEDVYAALTAEKFHPDLHDLDRIVTAVEHLDRPAPGGNIL